MVAERLVFVTGASGALGTALLAELRLRGIRIRALAHRRAVDGADDVIHGDLLEPASLESAMSGVDAVVHLAAVTHARHVKTYREVNVDGTRALIDAAVAKGVGRLVHVSTRVASCTGGAYARTKVEAEELVRERMPSATIVRLPEVLTGGGREGVDRLFEAAARGSTLFVVDRGTDVICPISVADAAAVLTEAAVGEAAAGETYTLAGACVTVREFALACREHFGTSSRIVGIPAPLIVAAQPLARILPLPLYPDQLARLRTAKPPPSQALNEALGFRRRGVRETIAAVASAQHVPVDVASARTP